MYRLAKAEAEVSTGSTLTANYGYTNDLLTFENNTIPTSDAWNPFEWLNSMLFGG